MMQSNEAAKKLLEHDDIATTLVVDSVMGFKRRKLSSLELPPVHEEIVLANIVKSVKKKQDISRALVELRSCEWMTEVTANMDEAENTELDEHLMKYMIGLTDEGGFILASETRYSLEGHQGAKVLATKGWSRGKQICNLVGSSREITDDFEQELFLQKLDTACIIRSSKSKSVLVGIGPISFINHSCAPNCEFVTLPNKLIGLVSIKAIMPGDELTISYGRDYFGRSNKNCECSDCEAQKKGAFGKLMPGEQRNRELFTVKEDRAILKVFLVLAHLNSDFHLYFCSIYESMVVTLVERVSSFGKKWRRKAS